MAGDDESLQIEQIIERLTARYPLASVGAVEHTVRLVYKRFDDCRIRDFVPLLVEKASRLDLEKSASPTG
ncbi:three-helix bundle dimerization domain-containing protein [Rhodococcoides kyotonense]|uniref:three-helix bundle dimerization domain-containing protein n=1 Tax=Rhodococcoides kyotonense TaxID=398843 RepID=UPI000B771BC3|nr:hypothetical protein [Rhodococcus kyotonensis]